MNGDKLTLCEDGLHFSTLHGGMIDGFPAVNIELGRERVVTVPALIASITSFAKSCVVKLSGSAHDNGSDALYALCSSLRDQGFFIAAELRGNEKRPWVDSVKYKIACIDEEPWLMYAAEEVRYSPSKGGGIPNPSLSTAHFNSFCYLLPHRDNAGEDIFDFLRTHPGFRVLSSKTYRKTITLREE